MRAISARRVYRTYVRGRMLTLRMYTTISARNNLRPPHRAFIRGPPGFYPGTASLDSHLFRQTKSSLQKTNPAKKF